MARHSSAPIALLTDPKAWLQRLAALCGLLVAVACTATAPKPPPAPGPAVIIPLAPPPPPVRPSSGDAKFDAFLAQARVTALSQGITEATFDTATAGLAPIPA